MIFLPIGNRIIINILRGDKTSGIIQILKK